MTQMCACQCIKRSLLSHYHMLHHPMPSNTARPLQIECLLPAAVFRRPFSRLLLYCTLVWWPLLVAIPAGHTLYCNCSYHHILSAAAITSYVCIYADRLRPGVTKDPMPGLIGEHYATSAELSGTVHYVGKPHALVYNICMQKLAAAGVHDATKVCGVGDSLDHDILGAARSVQHWQSAISYQLQCCSLQLFAALATYRWKHWQQDACCDAALECAV
jgi:HAD-hyrolase-like